MIRFSWICRATYAVVQSYLVRHFCPSGVLAPFIGSHLLADFRTLMANTDMVISGSVALRLFARATWPVNDLNLYVDRLYCGTVCTWLRNNGFIGERMTMPITSIGNLCRRKERRPSSSKLSIEIASMMHHTQSVEFRNTQTQKVVQVTFCPGTPVKTVLRFHPSEYRDCVSAEAQF